MAKAKPYTAAEKRLITAFARFHVYAEIEKDVMKPLVEKEKPGSFEPESYVKACFKHDPEAKRALNALRREIPKIRKEFSAQFKDMAND